MNDPLPQPLCQALKELGAPQGREQAHFRWYWYEPPLGDIVKDAELGCPRIFGLSGWYEGTASNSKYHAVAWCAAYTAYEALDWFENGRRIRWSREKDGTFGYYTNHAFFWFSTKEALVEAIIKKMQEPGIRDDVAKLNVALEGLIDKLPDKGD